MRSRLRQHELAWRVVALAFIAAAPIPASAADGPQARGRADSYAGELIVASHPAGWYLAFHDRKGNQEMREFLPEGQTVEKWQEMITVTVLHGISHIDPDRFMDSVFELARSACTDHRATRIFSGQEKGYPVAVRFDLCTRYKESALGEVTMYKVIQGRDSLYQVHRSLRVPPFELNGPSPISPQQMSAWDQYFRHHVFLCDTRVKDSCPAGVKP